MHIFPDISISNIVGGGQNLSEQPSGNVGSDRQNPGLDKISIYAKLDGDSSSSVNQFEAKTEISNGFSFAENINYSSEFMNTLKDLKGISNPLDYAKQLYDTAVGSFKDVQYNKIEISQDENVANVQAKIDDEVQHKIANQLQDINKNVSAEFNEMIFDVANTLRENASNQQETLIPEISANNPDALKYQGISIHSVQQNGTKFAFTGTSIKVMEVLGDKSYTASLGISGLSANAKMGNVTFSATGTPYPSKTKVNGIKYNNENVKVGINVKI